ncbi:hypothetical protein [Achromobacter xylosoxidans]|uniref:hypothetical protein n=1 Tax=Alcaligenes xylosoxydans xylosoxydans TaxID=85698 RepID=UPI0005D782D0|nr:hypothetical protein [Achromobacter xylosoxidans]QKQ52323.1 hypothetical protein FOC83_04790 [Achromobacter xylosoxidans]QPR92796.1 hypothetical protein I6G72_19230 [Achromobacter xylosoxidans]UON42474.1 hypothetical protein IUJ48_10350 [Achromobacter xylosoxidans]CKH65913.1 Uncharacterised protein [Achromobacter xylosoxidans]
MHTFKDTETGRFFQFDDDVIADNSAGHYVFRSPFGPVDAPLTLVPASLEEMPEPPAGPPASVSRYQGREAMRLTRFPAEGRPERTLFEAFEELLNDPTTPAYYRRAWDELQVFEHGSAMLNAAADVLGLTQAKRDDLFRLAAAIKA